MMNPFIQRFCRRRDGGSLRGEKRQAIASEFITQMIKNSDFSVEILGGYLHRGDGSSRGGAYGDAAQRAACSGMNVT